MSESYFLASFKSTCAGGVPTVIAVQSCDLPRTEDLDQLCSEVLAHQAVDKEVS